MCTTDLIGKFSKDLLWKMEIFLGLSYRTKKYGNRYLDSTYSLQNTVIKISLNL